MKRLLIFIIIIQKLYKYEFLVSNKQTTKLNRTCIWRTTFELC